MRKIALDENEPATCGTVTPSINDQYVPLKLLWVKVIIRAASDWVLYRESDNINMKRWAVDARKWLFEPSSLFNSLESVCFMFDLELKQVRKFANDLTRDQVKKMEFLERIGRQKSKVNIKSLRAL